MYDIFTKNRIRIPKNAEENKIWKQLKIDARRLRRVGGNTPIGAFYNGQGAFHYQISKSFDLVVSTTEKMTSAKRILRIKVIWVAIVPHMLENITHLTIEKDRNPDWRKIKIRNGQIVRQ